MRRARPKNKKQKKNKLIDELSLREDEAPVETQETEEPVPFDDSEKPFEESYENADVKPDVDNAETKEITDGVETIEESAPKVHAMEETAEEQYGKAPVKKGKKAKKKEKKKKSFGKILLTIISCILIIVLLLMGCPDLFEDTDVLAPIENGKINVLLLGVDEEGLRTDAIMIASYDVNEAKINLLSIPRDTKIRIENKGFTRKINEIHALSSEKKKGQIVGAEATAEAVSQLTGIPINYYVEFSFSAIDSLFDILGPVEFNVPDVEGGGRGMNYDDPYQNLHIHLKPGLQKLSGNQVQQFLRYRKSNYGVGTGSDIDRVERQKEFLHAVVEQKVNASILVKLPDIFKQISKEIHTNIGVDVITKYIRYIAKLSGESLASYSLPGENKTLGGGSYFVCDLEKTKELVESFGFSNEPTDKVTISDDHSQKVLRGGNKNKKPSPTPVAAETPTPTPESTMTPSPSPTPTGTPKPAVTPGPTKIPLEDIDDGRIILD